MSTGLMKMISYGMFIFAGIWGILTVFLWFYLDIQGVLDDLRGKKARLEVPALHRMVEMSALEEKATVALAQEVTALLNGYRLEINEMIVHTEERI